MLGLNNLEIYGKERAKQEECFWTEDIVVSKDCRTVAPLVNLDNNDQEIADKLSDEKCANLSISDLEEACKCVEKNIDISNEGAISIELSRIGLIERDVSRRIELKENLEKIITREYLFSANAKMASCDISKRFKAIMKSIAPVRKAYSKQKYQNKEKDEFCSPGYNPVQEINLFKNLQSGGIPSLDFDESIGAGLDLVINVIREASEDNWNNWNKEEIIPNLLSQVRTAVGEYLESNDEQFAKKIIINECSKKALEAAGGDKTKQGSDLCRVLKKLSSFSQPQKKSLKIALGIFTENNEAIEEAVGEFTKKIMDGDLNKIKQEQFINIRNSLDKYHGISCDNILGDKSQRSDIDTIKKYCSESSDPIAQMANLTKKDLVVENWKNLVTEYEAKQNQLGNVRKTLEYAVYQYCGSIRSTLKRLRNTQNHEANKDAKKKDRAPWINEFMKSNNIPEACLTTKNDIKQNKASASAPQTLITDKEIFLRSTEKPNLFSDKPAVRKAAAGKTTVPPQSVKGDNNNGGASNIASDTPPSIIGENLARDVDFPPPVENNSPQSGYSSVDDMTVPNLPLPSMIARKEGKENFDDIVNSVFNKTDDLDFLKNLFDKYMEKKQADQVNDKTPVNKTPDETSDEANKKDKEVIEALKKRIAALENGNKKPSLPTSKFKSQKNPVSISTEWSQNRGGRNLAKQPSVSPRDTKRSKEGGPGLAPAPFLTGGFNNSKSSSVQNQDTLRIPSKNPRSLKKILDKFGAKIVSTSDESIEVQLEDCNPPELTIIAVEKESEDEKCIFVKELGHVSQSQYLHMINLGIESTKDEVTKVEVPKEMGITAEEGRRKYRLSELEKFLKDK